MSIDWTLAACDGLEAWHDLGDDASRRRVCSRCPIRVDCLNWALDRDEPVGIWGGLTSAERRLLAGVRAAVLRHDLIAHVLAGVEPFRSLTRPEQVWLWRQHQRTGQNPNQFARRYRISNTTLHAVREAADQTDTHALAA